jgi:hypothetical protein
VLMSFGIGCKSRGDVYVKGKGMLPTYTVSVGDDLEFIKSDLKSTQISFETKL